jgi:hypothetical protein
VSPGSERTGIDIRLLRTPIIAVRGTVSGIPAEASLIHIAVRKVEPLTLSNGLQTLVSAIQRNVDPDGSFVQWRLDPGSCIISAQSYPEDWMSPPVEIQVAAEDIDRIAIRLMHPLDISGRVVFDEEEARFRATIPNASLAEPPHISIQGETGSSFYSSAIAGDGSFHFDKIRPERYHVSVSVMEVVNGLRYINEAAIRYVKSMRLGSADIHGSILDLRNSSGNPSLTMTLSSAAGEIRGIIRNADGPVPYARVLALWEPDSNSTKPANSPTQT